jgi:hypothetical protein
MYETTCLHRRVLDGRGWDLSAAQTVPIAASDDVQRVAAHGNVLLHDRRKGGDLGGVWSAREDGTQPQAEGDPAGEEQGPNPDQIEIGPGDALPYAWQTETQTRPNEVSWQ